MPSNGKIWTARRPWLEALRQGTEALQNSAVLLGDMEEIKSKIEKYQSNKKSSMYPEVEASTAAVAECYRCVSQILHSTILSTMSIRNKDTPLNCWLGAHRFKSSVEGLEVGNYFIFGHAPHN